MIQVMLKKTFLFFSLILVLFFNFNTKKHPEHSNSDQIFNFEMWVLVAAKTYIHDYILFLV